MGNDSCGTRIGLFLSGLLARVRMGGAASAKPATKRNRATIGPSVVYVQPGEEQRFKVVMTATWLTAAQMPQEVKWAVNDIPGGAEELGTIDDTGLYRAPSTVPSPREIHICAEVPEAANRWLWATVIVGDSPPRYRHSHIWSEPVVEGTGATPHLRDPHGIGLDADGNLLIADQSTNAVLRYTPQGEYLGRIGPGSSGGPGQFTHPRAVTSDDAGRIFVSDIKKDGPQIQVFSPAGELVQAFGESGRQYGMMLRVHGMDFDSQQRLHVVDVDNMRVSVYDNSGRFLHDWGTQGLNPGQFNAPHGLFLDKSGDVFVTGYYGPTQKFTSEGDFLLAFCHGSPPDEPIYFHNLTGDRWGNAYVIVRTKQEGEEESARAEGKRVSIRKYNNNGDFITEWSLSTPDHWESSAVVDADGHVYALFKGTTGMGVEVFVEE